MENTNEGEVEVVAEEEVVEQVEATEPEAETDWKAKFEEAQGKLKRVETKLSKAKEVVVEKKADLDETQLEYLDLKGVRDDEEIELVKGVMKKTGMTLRAALHDDYTQTKLAVLRKDRERLDATPGATRRAGGTAVNTVDYWVARHEQSGGKDLPKDFTLRAEVINRLVDRDSGNKPAWR
jgi:hypothetical protein